MGNAARATVLWWRSGVPGIGQPIVGGCVIPWKCTFGTNCLRDPPVVPKNTTGTSGQHPPCRHCQGGNHHAMHSFWSTTGKCFCWACAWALHQCSWKVIHQMVSYDLQNWLDPQPNLALGEWFVWILPWKRQVVQHGRFAHCAWTIFYGNARSRSYPEISKHLGCICLLICLFDVGTGHHWTGPIYMCASDWHVCCHYESDVANKVGCGIRATHTMHWPR